MQVIFYYSKIGINVEQRSKQVSENDLLCCLKWQKSTVILPASHAARKC